MPRQIEGAGLIDFGAPGFLGALHRELGVADQFLAIDDGLAAHGDANRTIDANLEIRQAERRRQRVADPLGDVQRVVRPLVQRQLDREFIAADSGQNIMAAQCALDPAGHRNQQFVARQRAHTGVDAAEPVEVDDQHGELGDTRLFDIRLQPLAKARPVGQAGQAVRQHFATQTLFGAQLCGAIDQRDHAATGGFFGRTARDADPEMAAIDRVAQFPVQFSLGRFRIDQGGDLLAKLVDQRRLVGGGAKAREPERAVDAFEDKAIVAQFDHRRRHGEQVQHLRRCGGTIVARVGIPGGGRGQYAFIAGAPRHEHHRTALTAFD